MKDSLSRRERQIMDRVYRRGKATAEEIREDLPVNLSNSAVRTMLSILEDKGFLRHELCGKRFVYVPMVSTLEAGTEAFRDLLGTFFAGSAAKAVAALVEASEGSLPPEEFERLEALIAATRPVSA